MVGSAKKLSGKSATKPVLTSSPNNAQGSTQSAPAKRKVVTSSEIEAAAAASKASAAPESKVAKAIESKPEAQGAPELPADTKLPAKPASGADQSGSVPSPSINPNLARKSPVAKTRAARRSANASTAATKSTAPDSPTTSEKASTVSTNNNSAAPRKSAASSAPKKSTTTKATTKKVAASPAGQASKAVQETAQAAKPAAAKAKAPVKSSTASSPAPTKPAATKVAKAQPAPKAVAKVETSSSEADDKQSDMFGFGALFLNGTGMEPYFKLWQTPEVEAMVVAGNDAFEESISAANEAFDKIFETMTGQVDVFSGAGSRVAAQYEELFDSQKKSFEEVWQASMVMFEKTGSIGTELSSWIQQEFEASQDILDELSNVESLADLQDLHTRIVNRCYTSGIAEGEKMQEIVFAAISDGLDAISKATNATMK